MFFILILISMTLMSIFATIIVVITIIVMKFNFAAFFCSGLRFGPRISWLMEGWPGANLNFCMGAQYIGFRVYW